MTKYKPTLLAILDGWGVGNKDGSDAIHLADTPNLDNFLKNNPHTFIKTNSRDVGLPDGVMGNSEVGHQNIGAGRIVYQALVKINIDIENGDFNKNEAICVAFDNAKKNNSAIHFIGLLSDGGVHSDISHLFALLQKAKNMGLPKVYVHALMDGRDTSPTSGINYMEKLENKIKEIGAGKIASVSGRYYGMDRDNNYNRNIIAYNTIVKGEGAAHDSPTLLLKESYAKDKTDEFIQPTPISINGETIKVQVNDSIVFFNFRPDRARQLAKMLINKVDNDVDNIFQGIKTPNITFSSMTQYQEGLNKNIAYPPQPLKNTMGEVISNLGMKQLRIAETEKYAHVTFFFNGGSEAVFEGEDRIIAPSPKEVDGYYDRKPEMAAYEVTEKLLDAINSNKYDFIVLNFANMDMVGHTGIIDAAKKAVTVVDTCIGKVVDLVRAKGGAAIITADHGNADNMKADDGSPMTAHSMNLVPFVIVSDEENISLKETGKLADISPSILDLLKIDKPSEMTGDSLIIR